MLAVALAKTIGTEYAVALVAPDGELQAELQATEFVEFAHTGLGNVLKYIHRIQHDAAAKDVGLKPTVDMLVVALPAYAKVIAEEGDGAFTTGGFFPLRQGCDYLAADFFE